MSDFDRQLASAREYEKAVADWLMKRGWRILPVYDFSGLQEKKAPRLMAFPGQPSLIMPDLLACKDGQSRWVEVKYKTRADFTRMTQRWETGLSTRLWTHYQRVQDASGFEVWVLFVHKNEREMRGGSVEYLLSLDPREMPQMGGMTFFPWERLQLLATLDDVFPPPAERAA